MNGNGQATGAFRRLAKFTPLWLAILYLAYAGISASSMTVVVAMLLFGGAISLVELRLRPARSFYRLGLVSAFIACLVVGFTLSGSGWLFGIVIWLGVSALGLIWTVHYERTEPLS